MALEQCRVGTFEWLKEIKHYRGIAYGRFKKIGILRQLPKDSRYSIKKCPVCNQKKSIKEYISDRYLYMCNDCTKLVEDTVSEFKKEAEKKRGEYNSYKEYCLSNPNKVTKKCSQCQQIKNLTKYKRSSVGKTPTGYIAECKLCISKRDKQGCSNRTIKNKEFYKSPEFKKTKKVCPVCNKEKYLTEYYKKANNILGVNYSCKECAKLRKKEEYIRNRDSYIKRACNNYIKNAEEKKEYAKKYNKDNWDKVLVRKRLKYRTSVQERLSRALRGRLNVVLKRSNIPKTKSVMKLVGCTLVELKKHLEDQFEPWMNWKNHSQVGWHIDHIKPCASFDLIKESEQRACFHYSNLQPLAAKKNLSKGAKVA